MPQIQTIEGLHDLLSLSQVPPDVTAREQIARLPPAERRRIEIPSSIDRKKWIKAAEIIRSALRENPNQTVLVPSPGGGDMEIIRDGGVVKAIVFTGKRVTLALVSQLTDFDNMTNVDMIRAASEADLQSADKSEVALIQDIASQLDSNLMLYVGVGVGVVAVLGLGWYLMKRPRRASFRGLAGTPSEHAEKAIRNVGGAKMMESLNRPVEAFELYAQAISECSWTGSEWPQACVEANRARDRLFPLIRMARSR